MKRKAASSEQTIVLCLCACLATTEVIAFWTSPRVPWVACEDKYCWFSHDVTKFQTSELLILLRFYFYDV